MTFTIARSIDDVLSAMANGARPIAGGSDLVVAARHGSKPLPAALVAIDRVGELTTIERNGVGLLIGAAVSHQRIIDDPTIAAEFSALADASALVGSPATRHVGTIGGNIMNGSPAMDTGGPLVVLGATALLRSKVSSREVPVGELWSGPGRLTATPDELCTAIRLPARPDRSGSAYVRLEYRRAMEIAVVGAAASVQLNADGSVGQARVALAAVAPTILEVTLDVAGRAVEELLFVQVAASASEQARPISDLRAGADYRRHTVGVMARRAFAVAVQRATGQSVSVPANRATGGSR